MQPQALGVALGHSRWQLGISEYFWLPSSDGVPTLAWIAGRAGAAVALVGAGFALLQPICHSDSIDVRAATQPASCNAYYAGAAFGPLLALHAVPLLSVPLAYALRGSPQRDVAKLEWHVGAVPTAGVNFQLRGRF